jgi:uncharacterized membrane-anchored protein YjiN (DUF445 family)
MTCAPDRSRHARTTEGGVCDPGCTSGGVLLPCTPMDARDPLDATAAGQLSAVEAGQRRALRRNRGLATSLLLLAGALFLAASYLDDGGFWIGLLRASTEASVVGGLADWFAVTAVFRRPLGLPIPHTAIVPRNKDRIGEGLGAFVAGNFLTAPLIGAKLRRVDPAGRIAAWLAVPDNAALLAERATQLLPHLLRALEDQAIRDFVVRALGEQLREADWAAALGRTIGALTSGAPFDAVFDRLLDSVQGLIEENSETVLAIVEERSAWWLPKAVDRRIASAIIAALAELATELRDPENPRRLQMRRRLAQLGEDLAHDPAHRARLESIKAELLDQPELKAWIAALWDGFRRLVIDDVAQADSRTREAAGRALLSLGAALAAEPAMRARLNTAIEEALLGAVVPSRHAIGRFIAEVVRGWETATVVERLELALGADLQIIRLTGTLVGACVGCVLYLLGRAIG